MLVRGMATSLHADSRRRSCVRRPLAPDSAPAFRAIAEREVDGAWIVALDQEANEPAQQPGNEGAAIGVVDPQLRNGAPFARGGVAARRRTRSTTRDPGVVLGSHASPRPSSSVSVWSGFRDADAVVVGVRDAVVVDVRRARPAIDPQPPPGSSNQKCTPSRILMDSQVIVLARWPHAPAGVPGERPERGVIDANLRVAAERDRPDEAAGGPDRYAVDRTVADRYPFQLTEGGGIELHEIARVRAHPQLVTAAGRRRVGREPEEAVPTDLDYGEIPASTTYT